MALYLLWLAVAGYLSAGTVAEEAEEALGAHAEEAWVAGTVSEALAQADDVQAAGTETAVAPPEAAALPAVLMGTYQVDTPQALKSEIMAAEKALSLRAVVDGPAVVYDSPSVSISVRKVSNEMLARNATKIEALDGAGVTVPRGVQGKSGKPVTITITSYHASEKLMKSLSEDLRVKFGKERAPAAAAVAPEGSSVAEGGNATDVGGNAAEGGSAEGAQRAGTDDVNASEASEASVVETANETAPEEREERVDFFTTKTSVSWRGTVNVKYAGLSATVPAHDRSPGKGPAGATFGVPEEVRFAEEKEEIYKEVETLASLDAAARQRGFRKLARRWHPDKNPEDSEKATDVFNYLQGLKEDLLGDGGRSGFRVFD